MWTVWNGAQQMVNSTTMVIIILTARFFFLSGGGGQQKGQGHDRTGTTSTLSIELFDLNWLNYLHLSAISQGVGTATILC